MGKEKDKNRKRRSRLLGKREKTKNKSIEN
jgi:hypothetical protein